MPKSTGYILETPLQTWSTADRNVKRSLLADEIEHVTMKQSRFVIVENTRGLQISSALQPALETLNIAGFTTLMLDEGNKSLIIGQKK